MPYERRKNQVRQKEYPVSYGIHKAIVTPTDWEKAKEKRLSTGVKSPSAVGRDRVHLLAGILRCPECGGPMYSNKGKEYIKKDGTVSEKFYNVCSRKRLERGKSCDYRASLRKDAIEPDVISALRALVKDPLFAEEIKSKIGNKR